MTPQNVSEAKLAWMIWQALEKLNSLLWDHYEKDFLSFALQEEEQEYKTTLSDIEPIDGSAPEKTQRHP
jgi:DNA polymerase IIIc chi subunit